MTIKSLHTRIEEAAVHLSGAEALLIGAGAGLSAAAGFDFTDKAQFARNYPGMLRHGFTCKLDMMANFSVPEELLWGYYLQHVQETRFAPGTHPVYQNLRQIAEKVENYFVITTNADGLFERNQFNPDRLYTPQGDYNRVQCLRPCSQDTWSTEALIRDYLPRVDKTTQKLPRGGAPRCPKCGGPTFLNVRGGDWFVEKPWIEGSIRYRKWLAENRMRRLVVMDIGSGFNTPVWIRWPAEELVRRNANARLLRLNLYHSEVPDDIAPRALSFAEGAQEVLPALVRA